MANTYISVFGDNVIPPSESSYAAVSLTEDTQFQWPELAVGEFLLYDLLDVSATGAWSILLPDASQVSEGRAVTFKNLSTYTITLKDLGLNTVGTITTGQAVSLYLTDNSTANGTWGLTALGAGTTIADATALAGDGLMVVSSKLATAIFNDQSSGNANIDLSNRAKAAISFATGAVTYTLPIGSSTYNGFFFYAINQGTGTLSIATQSGQTIDGQAGKILQPGESAVVFYGGASTNKWFTIGYGRSTQFQFTKLVLDISTGSPFNLTSTQAQNKLMQFIGTATANVTVNVPQIVAVYYLECSYLGAFTLTIKTSAGTGVVLSPNERAIVYCDGVNVVIAQTNIGTVNITGGVAGSVVYQQGPSVTGFTEAGTAGQVFVSGGGGTAPEFFDGVKLQDGIYAGVVMQVPAGVTLNTPDFSFQNSTPLASTLVGVLPGNGGTSSSVSVYSALPLPIVMDASTLTMTAAAGVASKLISGRSGSLTSYQPLAFNTSNTDKLEIAADTTGTYKFQGTAPRLIADFTNATETSRAMFRSSTTDGITCVGAVPNGTATQACFTAYGAADASNAAYTQITTTATQSKLIAGKTGAGSYKPLAINVGGADVATYSEAAATLGNMTASVNNATGNLIYTLSNTNANALSGVKQVITSNSGSLTTSKLSTAGGGSGIVTNTGGYLYVGTNDTGQLQLITNATPSLTIDYLGNVLVVKAAGGLGYGAGAGGTVTQTTSKGTDVTLNNPCGRITMHNQTLAGGGEVQFQINNFLIAASDFPEVQSLWSGVYWARVVAWGVGYAVVALKNTTGTPYSDNVQIYFNLKKGSFV